MTTVPLYCYYELSPHPPFPNIITPHNLLKIKGNVWQEFTSHLLQKYFTDYSFPLPFIPQLLNLISGSLTHPRFTHWSIDSDRLCGLEEATGLRHSPATGLPALSG